MCAIHRLSGEQLLNKCHCTASTCRAVPVHRAGLWPCGAGQASFCSSSKAPEMTNSHSESGDTKRALLLGLSCTMYRIRSEQSRVLAGKDQHNLVSMW